MAALKWSQDAWVASKPIALYEESIGPMFGQCLFEYYTSSLVSISLNSFGTINV